MLHFHNHPPVVPHFPPKGTDWSSLILKLNTTQMMKLLLRQPAIKYSR